MPKAAEIAVLVETSTTWGSSVVRGIAQYAREHGRWSIFLEARGFHEQLRIPSGWRGAGIIARVTSRRLVREIQALRVPCVNVSWSNVEGSGLCQVISDQAAAGRMAAQHLLDQGYRRFAYFGMPDQPHYVDHCGPAFEQALAERGLPCSSFQPSNRTCSPRLLLTSLGNLERWLERLPKPVGLLAWDSRRGRRTAEACANTGLRIPEEVGLICGYGDDLLCAMATPQLSCVDHLPECIGFEAAELLARLMAGEPKPQRPILIPPSAVIARHSTDALVIEDPAVAEAVRFIRDRAGKAIGVEDILNRVPVCRRLMEQRFLRVLGRSPAAEIRRVHIERAKELLIKTDLPVSRVAADSGFNHPEVMNRVFRREVGMTPTMYRRRYRLQNQRPTPLEAIGAKPGGSRESIRGDS